MTAERRTVDKIAQNIICLYEKSLWANSGGDDAETEDKKKPDIVLLSGILVAFWHTVLHSAARCEQFAIDEAERFAGEHGTPESTNVWNTNEFAVHLRQLYKSRHGAQQDDGKNFRSKMSVDYLFPFLLTMRFEAWFFGLPCTTNYSEQLLLRFEQALLPAHMRSAGKIDAALAADNRIFRYVWHKIMFGRTAPLNNCFAFFVHAISSRCANNVYWDLSHNWRVVKLFSIAGSLFNAPAVQNYTAAERAVMPQNGGDNPPQETTWLAVLLERTNGSNEKRFVHCTLATCDVKQAIFVRPFVPFMLLSPAVYLAPLLRALLVDDERLASKVKQISSSSSSSSLDTDMLALLQLCGMDGPQQPGADRACYQIDALEECQDIDTRMVEFFGCMVSASEHIVTLRQKLFRNLNALNKDKTIGRRQKHQLAQDEKSEVEACCTILEHLRDNCIATFLLLVQIPKILEQNNKTM